MHWVLAVINLRDKRFEYYDSMNDDNYPCIEVQSIALAWSRTALMRSRICGGTFKTSTRTRKVSRWIVPRGP
jgi:hypothetical protein